MRCAPFACAAALVATGCLPLEVGTHGQEIVGGTAVAVGDFPATVAVFQDNGGGVSLICSGTLIAPRKILTAAHCVGNKNLGVLFTEDVGAAMMSDIIWAESAIQHPDFNEAALTGNLTASHDLGMLTLEADAPVAPAAVIQEWEFDEMPLQTNLQIVGFGSTGFTAGDAGAKRSGEAAMTEVARFEIRVAEGGEPQSCIGDSGGSTFLVSGGVSKLVGVISRGPSTGDPMTECSLGGIDVRVDAHLDWLSQEAGIAIIPDPSGSSGSASSGGDTVSTSGGGTGAPLDDGGCSIGQKSGPTGMVWLMGVLLLWHRRRRR